MSNTSNPGPPPSAEEMLQRLYAVKLEYFDYRIVTEELKGKQAKLFVFVIPITAITLVTLTLLGTFLTDYFIVSFLISAVIVFMLGRIADQYERQFRLAAHQEVIRRVGETEGPFGLVPHFKDFLPKKYRHLWKSLKKGKYYYVEQYLAAIYLLQQQLNEERFTHIWYLRHPESAPKGYFDKEEDQ